MPLRHTKSYIHVDAPHGYGSSPGGPTGLRHHKLLSRAHTPRTLPPLPPRELVAQRTWPLFIRRASEIIVLLT